MWVKAIHAKIFRLFSGIWPRDLSPEPGEAFLALSSRQGCGQALGRAGGRRGFHLDNDLRGPWVAMVRNKRWEDGE